jgi:hypothetical protein
MGIVEGHKWMLSMGVDCSSNSLGGSGNFDTCTKSLSILAYKMTIGFSQPPDVCVVEGIVGWDRSQWGGVPDKKQSDHIHYICLSGT